MPRSKKLEDNTWVVETDSRGRINLGCVAQRSSRYRVEELEDGRIKLTPVVMVDKKLITPELAEQLGIAL
jgi:hypothetical protein